MRVDHFETGPRVPTGLVVPAGREWTESGHVGHLGKQSRSADRKRCCRVRRSRQVCMLEHNPVGTPPPPARHASRPLLLSSLLQLFFLLSLLILCFSSNPPLLNLVSLILRAFLDQNQWNLLQEVEDSPIYKWVNFRRNFVGSFYRI
jgi:hypothetical protein